MKKAGTTAKLDFSGLKTVKFTAFNQTQKQLEDEKYKEEVDDFLLGKKNPYGEGREPS